MIRRPPRSTRTDTHFPYTTLFRSEHVVGGLERSEDLNHPGHLDDRLDVRLFEHDLGDPRVRRRRRPGLGRAHDDERLAENLVVLEFADPFPTETDAVGRDHTFLRHGPGRRQTGSTLCRERVW